MIGWMAVWVILNCLESTKAWISNFACKEQEHVVGGWWPSVLFNFLYFSKKNYFSIDTNSQDLQKAWIFIFFVLFMKNMRIWFSNTNSEDLQKASISNLRTKHVVWCWIPVTIGGVHAPYLNLALRPRGWIHISLKNSILLKIQKNTYHNTL